MKMLVSFCLLFFLQAQLVFSQTNPYYYGKNFSKFLPRNTLQVRGFRPLGAMDVDELKSELFKILTLNHIEKADQGYDAIVHDCSGAKCYKQTMNDYTDSRAYIYNQLDIQTNPRGGNFVKDVYCHQIFSIKNPSFQGRRVPETKVPLRVNQPSGDINIEHTWPKSKFTNEFSNELQKGDLHHLFPSNGTINGIRSSYPFGEVVKVDSQIPNCPSVLGTNNKGDLVFEPNDNHKGNVARAIFYFSIRYNSPIDKDEEDVLRKWDKLDPVDEAEAQRNENIFNIQHNRNPFIDYPILAKLINDF